MSVSDTTRREVWVAAGGHCCYCKRPVDLGTAGAVASFGEVAHNVGQGSGPNTPRGSGERSADDKDSFENLLLLCPNDHRLADGRLKEHYSEEALAELKASHEASVALALSYAFGNTKALVCRLAGHVQGTKMSVPGPEAITASLRDGLIPITVDRHDHIGQHLDLSDPSDDALRSATQAILADWVTKVRSSYEAENLGVVAVFAIADLPSLIQFGYLLNEIPIRPFQRSPQTGSWQWDSYEQTVEFALDTSDCEPGQAEVVVLLDISGTTSHASIPTDIADLPTVRIHPKGRTGSRDIIKSSADVSAFRDIATVLVGFLESQYSKPLTVHVLGPVPVSIAVAVGNVMAHPAISSVVLYDFDSDYYTKALTL